MKRGFTLVEVLMAMGIFLIGMVMVAALFPAAALVQKETIADVNAEQVRRTVKAMLSARQFRESDLIANLPPGFDTSGEVVALPESAKGHLGGWSHRDRSWPSSASANKFGAVRASFYWVPMIRDADPRPGVYNWQVFAFILAGGERDFPRAYPVNQWANFYDGRYDENADAIPPLPPLWINTTPAVGTIAVTVTVPVGGIASRFDFANNPRLVRTGESVLDELGVIHKVADDDDNGVVVDGFISAVPRYPSEIWIAIPVGDKRSPAREIVIITDGVNHGT